MDLAGKIEMELGKDPLDEIEVEISHGGAANNAAPPDAEAEDVEDVINNALVHLNDLAKARVPEMVHSKKEINAIARLLNRVVQKHWSVAQTKYGPEIMLGTYLLACEGPRVIDLARRIQKEKEEANAKLDPPATREKGKREDA